MEEILIGRDYESGLLEKYIASEKSEFIAVYGRRRVGKTFFIRKVLENRMCFAVSGVANVGINDQLTNFYLSMRQYFSKTVRQNSWLEAFDELRRQLEKSSLKTKILFIDEMPWLDTARSGFIAALEHFWNSWGSAQKNVKMIVCGSATSWMIDNLINSRGGLHNRVTHQICIEPFTLDQCKEYFKTYKFAFGIREITDCYMVFGGVPYYLSLMDKTLSVAQNIDKLFFAKNADLRYEADNLFRSLFLHSEDYVTIVSTLGKKMKGLTRAQLLETTKLQNNARFTSMLKELEQCGFIRSYTPFDGAKRSVLYQLVDSFVNFNIHFASQNNYQDEEYWTHSLNSGKYNAWSGYAFEILCLNHTAQIKKALSIAGIQSKVCSWLSKGDNGSQIDLLIDRADQTVNLCELKYYRTEYELTKADEKNIDNKLQQFLSQTKTVKSIRLTMITSFGIKPNKYSGYIQNSLTLSDLM